MEYRSFQQAYGHSHLIWDHTVLSHIQ